MFKNHKKKNNFFIKNHKAQVGETMTWIVATLVIIVLLTVSVVVAKLNFNSNDLEIEKQSDLISIKSISGFLINEDNLNLVKESVNTKDYSTLKLKIKTFLETLPKENSCSWNFQLKVNDNEEFQISLDDSFLEYSENYEIIFKLKENQDEIILRFWEIN